MDEQLIRGIVNEVLNRYENEKTSMDIPVEVSARHVHLTKADIETLFGKGYKLTPKKDLSQPGQYLCEERLKIVTKKGEFNNVAILGPPREKTQVEISATDTRSLGLNAPINMSGNLKDADSVAILSEKAFVWVQNSVIIAKAHIHMTEADAKRFGVKDNQSVKVKVFTKRPITFDDVIVRISDKFSLAMHIDFDEANACFAKGNIKGKIIV